MARMHSRKKGKSGSKRPIKKTQPSWIRYKPKEVEMLIIKLIKEGKTSSEIGLILRDTYGIPYIKGTVGKRINQILKERSMLPKIPDDLLALIKRGIALKKHMEKNNKDNTALRGIQLTESKIKRLVKYYKSNGRIPASWKYEPDKIRLYLE